jgi:FlaA1/EpsC-like NDP-sugar epimerase
VIASLESIDWHSFLARPLLPFPSPATIQTITRDPILITGAGGSIGSALALRLAAAGASLILLETSESSLFDLQRNFADLPHSSRATFYLGSAADRSLMSEIFWQRHPRLVFHAAAFKHVPLLEDQPLAAIGNNIFATETLLAAASANHARVVLVSTDKAVAPASVMGATKRIAEQVVLGAGGTVLRLGNVLATRGSVTEVFARQLAAGLPLTVTDPAARRYFLTIEEAVGLLISAAPEPHTPSLLAPQLPSPHFIADLARYMARCLAPARQVSIEFTHLRMGDKETENLWSASETPYPVLSNGLVSIHSPCTTRAQLDSSLDTLHSAVSARDLSAALTVLRTLVADYSPSDTVLKLRDSASSPVAHE